MTIDSLKQLKALIQLCQKEGVTDIEVDGIKLSLGAKPVKRANSPAIERDIPEASIKVPAYNGAQIEDKEETEPASLTEEQLLFYSVDETAQAEDLN